MDSDFDKLTPTEIRNWHKSIVSAKRRRRVRRAKKEAENLEERMEYDIFVLPKGKYSIVCVGKFPQEDRAKVILNKLRKRYKDCLVRRL